VIQTEERNGKALQGGIGFEGTANSEFDEREKAKKGSVRAANAAAKGRTVRGVG
jgi:hypothetical protein